MNINVTLIVQMIAFGLFIWTVMRWAWPPITKAMQNRQARISDGLAAAERGSQQLQQAAAKADETLKQAKAQAQEIIGAVTKQASQIVEQARAQARSEAERIKEAAQAEAERELARARDELRRKVGDLAVLGAARILRREIDASKHADVLNELAAKV